jgi:hypothetical protein
MKHSAYYWKEYLNCFSSFIFTVSIRDTAASVAAALGSRNLPSSAASSRQAWQRQD